MAPSYRAHPRLYHDAEDISVVDDDRPLLLQNIDGFAHGARLPRIQSAARLRQPRWRDAVVVERAGNADAGSTSASGSKKRVQSRLGWWLAGLDRILGSDCGSSS